MRYTIRDGEGTHRVEIEELGGHVYEIRVDEGDPVRVDAQCTPPGSYSLLIDGRQYEGGVDEGEGDAISVHVGTESFGFEVSDARREVLLGAAAGTATGRQELRAQMPGKVVKLLVADGETVETGQPLVVIEAMKMENELRSPAPGSIASISVQEGAAVEGGALLLVVEPPEEDA